MCETRASKFLVFGIFLAGAITCLIMKYQVIDPKNKNLLPGICVINNYTRYSGGCGLKTCYGLDATLSAENDIPCKISAAVVVVWDSDASVRGDYQLDHPIGSVISCYIDCLSHNSPPPITLNLFNATFYEVFGWICVVLGAFSFARLCCTSSDDQSYSSINP